MSKPAGAPCYQHDNYHAECSDCYHPEPERESWKIRLARSVGRGKGITLSREETKEVYSALSPGRARRSSR